MTETKSLNLVEKPLLLQQEKQLILHCLHVELKHNNAVLL